MALTVNNMLIVEVKGKPDQRFITDDVDYLVKELATLTRFGYKFRVRVIGFKTRKEHGAGLPIGGERWAEIPRDTWV